MFEPHVYHFTEIRRLLTRAGTCGTFRFMTDEDRIDLTGPYTRKAEFPIHWAGMTKDGIFVCGACPNPELCLAERCTRASDESWEHSDNISNIFRSLIV